MKKYIKFLIIFLAIAVVIPQVALAAWWNPFSWNWGRINSIFHFQQTAQKQQNQEQKQDNVVCAMDAKICPDGSYVSREGPKCEFKACPESKKDKTAGWKTYTNAQYGFEIKYPIDWKTDVKVAGEYGAYSLNYFAVDNNQAVNNIYPYLLVVVEDNNFTLGTRDWNNFELSQIKGKIAYSASIGNEIVFKSPSGQNFYIRTKNNPTEDKITQQILSTFKFTGPIDENVKTKEQGCIASGGKVIMENCNCPDSVTPADFYNHCIMSVSTCFCDPSLGIKKQLKTCDCGSSKCWNGTKCSTIEAEKNK